MLYENVPSLQRADESCGQDIDEVAVGDGERVTVGVGVGDREGVGEEEVDGVEVEVGLGTRVTTTDGVGLGVGDWLEETVGDEVGLGDFDDCKSKVHIVVMVTCVLTSTRESHFGLTSEIQSSSEIGLHE